MIHRAAGKENEPGEIINISLCLLATGRSGIM